MKRLFDKNDKYTETAHAISRQIAPTVREIFKDYSKQGFSIREISHILILEIIALEAEAILTQDYERAQENLKKGK